MRDHLYHDPMPVGLIAVCLILGSSALFQLSVSLPLVVAAFFGTALVYGLDRAVISSPEDKWNRPERRRWVQNHQTWLRGEIVLLLIGGGIAVGFLSPRTLFWIAGLAGGAGLHLFSVGMAERPLKSLGIGKPLAVAAAWAVGGTVLPILEAGQPLGIDGVMLTVYRFLFILPNVLLADWADRGGDAAVGLTTWAPDGTLFSVRLVSTGLLAVAGAGVVFAIVRLDASLILLVDAVGLLLMTGAVWALRPGRSPREAFLLDFVVAWPIVVWIASLTLGL